MMSEEVGLNVDEDLFFLEFGQKNNLNFGKDLFSFGDHLILDRKTSQSD